MLPSLEFVCTERLFLTEKLGQWMQSGYELMSIHQLSIEAEDLAVGEHGVVGFAMV